MSNFTFNKCDDIRLKQRHLMTTGDTLWKHIIMKLLKKQDLIWYLFRITSLCQNRES